MSYHAFLIRYDNCTILVDTCCGNDKHRPTRPDFHHLKTDFLTTLSCAGVKPEEVDYVMCTHLHWDHVGWNTRLIDGRWVPTFPNAKYIISKTEFDFWDEAYRRDDPSVHCTSFADSILPVKRAEQVVLVGDDFDFGRGISFEPCHGHSPGHVVINIASEGRHAVVTGDVIHHQLQILVPSLASKADADPDLARRSRIGLLEKLSDSGSYLLPGHFPSPTIGRIASTADGFRLDTSDR